MFRSLAWILCVLGLGPIASANDASMEYQHGVNGGALVPVKNEHVRMVREFVGIDAAFGSHTVKADFWLENTSDQPQELIIAFPFDWFREIPPYNLDKTDFIQRQLRPNLEVLLRDKKVEVEFSEAQRCRQKGRVVSFFYRIWAFWTVSFEPHETLHTRTSYTMLNSTAGNKGGYESYLIYFLRSGQTWKAPIESSTVRLRFGDDFKRGFTAYPEGYVQDLKNCTLTWQFKGKLPDTDIYFGNPFSVKKFESMDEERKSIWEETLVMPPSPPNETLADGPPLICPQLLEWSDARQNADSDFDEVAQYDGDDEEERQRRADEKKERESWLRNPLSGEHAFDVLVEDSETGESLSDYTMHVSYLEQTETEWDDNAPYDAPLSDWHRCARFESRKINNQDGACRYGELPPGWYEVLIEAEGFAPQRKYLYLPEQDFLKFAMAPLCAVSGKLLHGETGEGISGVSISLRPDHDPAMWHNGSSAQPPMENEIFEDSFSTKTDGSGSFTMVVPQSKYEIYYSGISSLWQLVDSANRSRNASGREQSWMEAWNTAIAQPLLESPKIRGVLLRGRTFFDLGTQSLGRAPVVNLLALDARGEPLVNHPIQVMEHKDPPIMTGSDGRVRIPLAGFSEGTSCTISLVRLPNDGSAKSVRHLNERILWPKAGEEISLTMRLVPDRLTIPLHVRFLDEATSKPITNAVAQLVFNRDILQRSFPMSAEAAIGSHWTVPGGDRIALPAPDLDGRIDMDALVPSVNWLSDYMDYQNRKEGKEPNQRGRRAGGRGPEAYVCIDSPGYVNCAFVLDAQSMLSGKRFEIRLPAEATLSGRVVDRDPAPTRRIQLDGIMVGPDLTIRREGSDGTFIFPSHVTCRLRADGSYEFRGLLPDMEWWARLYASSGSIILDKGLRLHEGSNAAGDIDVTVGGRISVVAKDAFKNPLRNASVTLSGRGFGETNEKGVWESELGRVEDPVQMLKVTVPKGDGDQASAEVGYVREIVLKHGSDNNFSLNMRRGNTLQARLKIPSTFHDIESQLLEEYRNDHPYDKRKVTGYGITGLRLIELTTGPDGFRFMRDFSIPGDAVESQNMMEERVFAIPDIPKGRYALQADASAYALLPGLEVESYDSQPVAFAEFDMPGRDHEVTVAVAGHSVELLMEDRTERSGRPFMTGVFLVRAGSPFALSERDQSAIYPGQSILTLRKWPFELSDPNATPPPHVVRFGFVPPGTYQMRLQTFSPGPTFHVLHEQTIQVAENAEEGLQFIIPIGRE